MKITRIIAVLLFVDLFIFSHEENQKDALFDICLEEKILHDDCIHLGAKNENSRLAGINVETKQLFSSEKAFESETEIAFEKRTQTNGNSDVAEGKSYKR